MEARTFTQEADTMEEAAAEGTRMLSSITTKIRQIREDCSSRKVAADMAKELATAAKRRNDTAKYTALKQAKKERREELEKSEHARDEAIAELKQIEKELGEARANMTEARSRAKKHIECAVACEKSGDHAIGRVKVEQELERANDEQNICHRKIEALEKEKAEVQDDINKKEQLLDRLSTEILSLPPTSRIRSVHQAKIRLNRQEVAEARQKFEELEAKVASEQKQEEKSKKEITELKETLERIERFSHRKKFEDRLSIMEKLNLSSASLKNLNQKIAQAKSELEDIDDLAVESKELLELVEEARVAAETFMLYPGSDRA
ncbi:hypothetical protein FOL47_007871 [Perkinsus chesapeaki]|uniref:Uncharacterized protein n=1 Tax=Perkinsus chesapeaki TaxID=330153 RepID=A0A7J6LHU8_PERCH|nr:hypothetical protein FOL47_007871 [Perkinsus chesapeaki]